MQLLTEKEIKAKEDAITKGIKYRPNFYGEILADLERNNMNLALLASKDVMSDEDEPDQKGVMSMILIALKMLGATDNFDKNYHEVSVKAISESKRVTIERKDPDSIRTGLIPDEVAKYLSDISPFVMKDSTALPDKVFARLESYIKLILTAGAINTMAMPH